LRRSESARNKGLYSSRFLEEVVIVHCHTLFFGPAPPLAAAACGSTLVISTHEKGETTQNLTQVGLRRAPVHLGRESVTIMAAASLNISGLGLTSTVSATVGNLTYLESLILEKNQLSRGQSNPPSVTSPNCWSLI
jgi:hypothetical protein